MAETTPHDWLNAHGDYLFRFALARLRDPHLAEDAVQETLLAAMQNQAYTGKAAPRTWLTGILKHKIIDLIRRQSREQLIADTDHHGLDEDAYIDAFFQDNGHWLERPADLKAPDGALEEKQLLQILQRCMEKLPKKLASLFLMREIHEEDNEMICKELGISPTNAWVMLYRARLGLRQCLELHWLGR